MPQTLHDPNQLLLLSRENCGLCDQAWLLIEHCGLAQRCVVRDIDADLPLIRRFGDRVPVLTDAGMQQCLYWPFDDAAISEFVEQQND